MMTVEQLMTSHKANVETLFGLTSKAFEGMERLIELNVQVAKAAMVEAADTTQAVLSVKDGQELLAATFLGDANILRGEATETGIRLGDGTEIATRLNSMVRMTGALSEYFSSISNPAMPLSSFCSV